ncbi:MAG: DegV family EDD domain-containing protein, partial [Syntrophomonadaceae bacterium]|nr:DegV family EDD domain-containing protein [Syntrophomonadaceae bacterium]
GGRVKATSAAIGNLLNIKLILHLVDGEIVPLEKVHGFKKARKRMLDIMRERGVDLRNQTIGISYSKDFQGALELKEMIKENFGCQDFIISEIGAVIGSHVGAGTYSVFFLGE